MIKWLVKDAGTLVALVTFVAAITAWAAILSDKSH